MRLRARKHSPFLSGKANSDRNTSCKVRQPFSQTLGEYWSKFTEMMVHHLITATDLEHAESGIMEMGRTWWPALKREDDRHCQEYPGGVVWFNSITLLDDVENSILRGLKFLDAWTVTGTPDAPVLRDEWGNDWRDITR